MPDYYAIEILLGFLSGASACFRETKKPHWSEAFSNN
jgi:hypothetical protein